VAFANGCFDLLHAGHYKFLRAARSHGDQLVIGLNSDQSVKTLKGANRPFLPFVLRRKLLLESGLVDEVIEFDDADASRLLQKLTVHVYVRSVEYARKATAEDRVIAEQGVIPVYVERTPSVSTTSLIQSVGHD
jgi:rfaE bifunctional protein nucleotidyltransferase chain/domain